MLGDAIPGEWVLNSGSGQAKCKLTKLDTIDKIISDLEGRSQEHTDTRPRQKDIKEYKIWLKDMMAGVRWAKITQS